MSNDISILNSTVTAIQGESISTTTPQDGYSLVWDGYSQQWQPKLISFAATGLNRVEFNSNGTWTCPVGVNNVLITGFGGGGGRLSPYVAAGNGGNGGSGKLVLVY